MAVVSSSGQLGPNGGNATNGSCPLGQWISTIKLRMGNDLEGIGWLCTGGQGWNFNSGGGSWDRANTIWNESPGFSAIEVYGGSELDSFQLYKANGDAMNKQGTNGGGSVGKFTCPSKTVLTGMTVSGGNDVNWLKAQCGYKTDCATAANAFNPDCIYWRQQNPELSLNSQNAYCSTHMTDDPQCKSLAQAKPENWIPAITNYCKGDTLRTDSAFCSALCNKQALNGLCDTALTTYCINPKSIVSAADGGGAEVCGCYMPGNWYVQTQESIAANLSQSA
jgi:hypothetical protein